MELKELKLKDNVYFAEIETSLLQQEYFISLNERQWKVKDALYLLVKSIKEGHSTQEFLDIYRQETGKMICLDDVEKMLNLFVIKNGLLIGTEDTKTKKSIGGKHLWGKVPLISGKYLNWLKVFNFLYWKPITISAMCVVCLGIVVCFGRLIENGYTLASILSITILDSMEVLIICFLSTLIHEFGHMSYMLRNNLPIGNIGFAFYYLSPVLYSDVKRAWEMQRKKRQILDIAGIYFQSLFLTIVGCFGVIFNRKSFILALIVGMINVLKNLNPFLKMDGYWWVSDYLGIPNLHAKTISFFKERLKSIFKVKSKTYSIVYYLGDKEKKQFLVYSIMVIVYMAFFYIGLLNVFGTTFEQLFCNIKYFWRTEILDKEVFEFIKQNFMLIFTFVLSGRILIVMMVKFISSSIQFAKDIMIEKRKDSCLGAK